VRLLIRSTRKVELTSAGAAISSGPGPSSPQWTRPAPKPRGWRGRNRAAGERLHRLGNVPAAAPAGSGSPRGLPRHRPGPEGEMLTPTRSPRYWIGPWTALIISAVSPAAPAGEHRDRCALGDGFNRRSRLRPRLPADSARLALLRVEKERATQITRFSTGSATDTAARTRYSREVAARACGVVGGIDRVAAAAA
jgi:hypothetical protein